MIIQDELLYNAYVLHIAIEYRCTPESAFEFLEKLGRLKRPPQISTVNNADVQDIKIMLDEGLTENEVAKIYGISACKFFSVKRRF